MSETVIRATQVLPPPSRRSLADEVSERLGEAILRGRIKPGEQLSANRLAASMGISPGPIREALRRLEREGLVVMRHSRTPVVAELSLQDLDEVFSLRSALEHLSVQYACRNATADDWKVMQAVIDTIAAYVIRGITEAESAELDLRFHDLLYQAGKHQRLIAFWSDLRPQIHVLLLRRNLVDTHFQDAAVGGHQDILDAVNSCNEAQAVAVMQAHLQGGFNWVTAGLE